MRYPLNRKKNGRQQPTKKPSETNLRVFSGARAESFQSIKAALANPVSSLKTE
jgi:hypothetical protein